MRKKVRFTVLVMSSHQLVLQMKPMLGRPWPQCNLYSLVNRSWFLVSAGLWTMTSYNLDLPIAHQARQIEPTKWNIVSIVGHSTIQWDFCRLLSSTAWSCFKSCVRRDKTGTNHALTPELLAKWIEELDVLPSDVSTQVYLEVDPFRKVSVAHCMGFVMPQSMLMQRLFIWSYYWPD